MDSPAADPANGSHAYESFLLPNLSCEDREAVTGLFFSLR